jgi:2-polyprenyl-3-methyl-5-hydroxy-6-metoxy-1,4-benzoquinol methylase
MRLRPWLLILAAIGLSSFATGRAAGRTNANPRVQTVRGFYSALVDEMSRAGYDASERSLLAHPHDYYGRYLDQRSRDYVALTVMPRIADAISFFELEDRPKLRIFDLGCGLGMQSLIFASLGATVVGVDVRDESIQLCRKRKAYYERELGRELDVEFHGCDFTRANVADFDPPFDALFSMSAFSYVKPLDQTARRVSQLLSADGRVFLYEENAAFALDRWKRSETLPTPAEVERALAGEGFRTEVLRGAGSIPRGLWRVPALNETMLVPANEVLRRSLRLSFKYVLAMKRHA